MHFIISCSYTCKYRPNGWANPLHPGVKLLIKKPKDACNAIFTFSEVSLYVVVIYNAYFYVPSSKLAYEKFS